MQRMGSPVRGFVIREAVEGDGARHGDWGPVCSCKLLARSGGRRRAGIANRSIVSASMLPARWLRVSQARKTRRWE